MYFLGSGVVLLGFFVVNLDIKNTLNSAEGGRESGNDQTENLLPSGEGNQYYLSDERNGELLSVNS